MTAKQRAAITKLLSRLQRDTAAQLIQQPGGSLELVTAAGPSGLRVSATLARSLSASGLIDEREPGRFFALGAAAAWLKRRGDTELGFRRQHHTIERTSEPGLDAAPLKNLEESAVAALARRAGKSGEPWLAPHAVAAAERLRRDFEMGQMQPRITANWTASVAKRQALGRFRRAGRLDRGSAWRPFKIGPGHGGGRPGSFRTARRYMLFPERPGDCGAGTAMARSVGKAGAADRAGGAGPPLRSGARRARAFIRRPDTPLG